MNQTPLQIHAPAAGILQSGIKTLKNKPMISITQISIAYQAGFEYITPLQFKKVFSGSFTLQMKEALKQNNIAFDLAFNRKEINDNGEPEGQLIIRYPLVQYHTRKNTLVITGIEKGAKLIEIWMDYLAQGNELKFRDKVIEIRNIEKNTQYWNPQIVKKPQIYLVRNWKPFKSEYVGNKTKFDGIIWGNIHQLLDNLNIRFLEKVVIDILEYKRKNMSKGYKIDWITYDLVFSTNVNLPQQIGIGHEVSLGSGRLTKAKYF